MPQYPLTERQKAFLLELAQKFEQGMGSQFALLFGDDSIVGAFAFGGDERINPPTPDPDDLHDYVQAGLMSIVGYDKYGLASRIQFHKQLVIDAVRSGYEMHPSLQRGIDIRRISVGTSIGSNIGFDSHFENITQNVQLGSSLSNEVTEALRELVSQLMTELSEVPDDEDDKEAIKLYTQDLVQGLGEDKPNKTRIKITLDGLVKASENIRRIAPGVIDTAVKISALVSPLLPK